MLSYYDYYIHFVRIIAFWMLNCYFRKAYVADTIGI